MVQYRLPVRPATVVAAQSRTRPVISVDATKQSNSGRSGDLDLYHNKCHLLAHSGFISIADRDFPKEGGRAILRSTQRAPHTRPPVALSVKNYARHIL